MAGQPHSGAVKGELAGACQHSQSGCKHRRRKSWVKLKAQSLHADSRQIRIVRVKGLQVRGQAEPELHPACRRENEQRFPDGNADQSEAVDQSLRLVAAEALASELLPTTWRVVDEEELLSVSKQALGR
ncbi:hypothetical protein [Mesorhizobium sp. f-mel]